mmetsp:Transcript_12290/g.29201  ORF Transcript_12290/g.29201 Transcript_12290/m.29201 type:complete len:304 (+) Transcript_12290:158-1069(+)
MSQPRHDLVQNHASEERLGELAILDSAHVEAYTVMAIGLLQAVYMIYTRAFSGKAYPNGCRDVPLQATGGGCISTKGLLALRILICIYCVGIGVYHTAKIGMRINRFYTQWNWILLTAYFGLAARESWQLMKAPPANGGERKVGLLGQATVVLFHVCTTMAMLVDVVTWTVLVPMLTTYNSDPKQGAHFYTVFHSFVSYNQHGVNLVFMLLDFALGAMPYFPHMLGYVQLLSVSYGVWASAYFVLSGTWLYPFLDTSKPYAWEAYLALFAAHWVFYLVLHLLSRTKEAVLRRASQDTACKKGT